MSDLTETSPSVEEHRVVTSLPLMKVSRVASEGCGVRYLRHAAANVVQAHSAVVLAFFKCDTDTHTNIQTLRKIQCRISCLALRRSVINTTITDL